MKKKFSQVVLVTGGFDPLHSGHIAYLNAAKEISDYLIVGINSDEWLLSKKKYFFMPFKERKAVIENLKSVDKSIAFNDSDGTAIDAINICKDMSEKVFFANGGDRNEKNIPELSEFKNDNSVEFVFGIGGKFKINSSSIITDEFLLKFRNKAFQKKPWGSFINLNKGNGYKIKLLVVKKDQKLSFQYHNRRSEQWIILRGTALIQLEDKLFEMKAKDHIIIPKKAKHRVENIGNDDLLILEANFGSYIEEDDIVRLEDIYNRVV